MVDGGNSRINCLGALVLSRRTPRGIGCVGQRSRAERIVGRCAVLCAEDQAWAAGPARGLAGAQHRRMGHPGSCGSTIPGTAGPLQCAGGARSRRGQRDPIPAVGARTEAEELCEPTGRRSRGEVLSARRASHHLHAVPLPDLSVCRSRRHPLRVLCTPHGRSSPTAAATRTSRWSSGWVIPAAAGKATRSWLT